MATEPNGDRKREAGSDSAAGQRAVHAPPSEPIATPDRLPVLDVLRGVALLGILIVNMRWFTTPQDFLERGAAYWTEPSNRAVEALIALFAEMKFYSLFAMLFGAGIAIQYRRAEAAGRRMAPQQVRRMLSLLVFGALHAVFIWIGDILMTYAITGLLSFFFCRLKPLHQLISALCLICLPAVMCCMTGSMVLTASLIARGSLGAEADTPGDTIGDDVPDDVRAYRSSNYWDIVRYRIRELPLFMLKTLSILPHTLGLFLLGQYMICAGVLSRVRGSLRDRLFWWVSMLALGGAGTVLAFALQNAATGSELLATGLRIISISIHLIAAPMLALFYALSIFMLYEVRPVRSIAFWLVTAGRMSLTNYIGQSLVCSVIFYGSSIFGWGMGMYARIDPVTGLVLSVAIWPVQVALSNVWLAIMRMRYGPLEWVWRCVTYWQLLPLRA
jgi:uncharacterized protein